MKDQADVNPILDKGKQSSVGGIVNAASICDALGMEFKVDPAQARYHHGWGHGCAEEKQIV